MSGETNAESLHNVGQGTNMKTDSKFVNPGTPVAPLVKESDMPSAQVSNSGTATLRNSLIKDR